MKEKLKIKLNGKPVSLEAEGDMRLLWLIRTDLGLTGTKCGCGEGYCGACTVLINGKAVAFLPDPGSGDSRPGAADH